MNRLDQAQRLFYEALECQENGDLDAARNLYLEALALTPDRPSVLVNLSAVLMAQEKFAEAEEYCRRAIGVNAEDAVSWMNLGLCSQGKNEYPQALAYLDRALGIEPDYAEAWSNRGTALKELDRFGEALACIDKAIALKPDFEAAYSNRARVLKALDRFDEALACYDQALALKPGDPDALNGLADALRLVGRLEESASTWNRLLSAAPDYPYALGELAFAKMHMCDWSSYGETIDRLASGSLSGNPATLPFPALSMQDDPDFQLACARHWAAGRFPSRERAAAPRWKRDHARIRIAYLSSDFNNHAVSRLSAELYELHDRNRFDVYGISWGTDDSSGIRKRIEKGFDHFVDVRGESSEEAVRLIQGHEIDIAINLNGYTLGEWTRIFAFRPAPVSVSYLGYPGTMGAGYIDYLIADPVLIPEENRRYFTEKIAYLPDTYQVNDSKRPIAERKFTRSELGLPETGFVFCCFNNNYKITPDVFDVWMRLLKKVEGSVLWLLEDNPASGKNLRAEAQARGVAAKRLVFARRIDLPDHLSRHRQADLFLDTFYYNAHTTASDSLWTGVPVLTCLGNSFQARVAASLLNAVGLPELITKTAQEYEALAFELATRPERLFSIRKKLAENRLTHPLFDTARFTRHLESAYEEMWRRHQRGEAPETFSVAPIG